MNIEEAFRLLQVPDDADEDAIVRSFRSLSKAAHPDVPGGNSDKQKSLNQARDMAIGYAQCRRAIVPIHSSSLILLERVLAIHAAGSAAEKATSIHRRSTRRMNCAKWVCWIFAGAAAVAALLASNVPMILGSADENAKAVERAVALLALVTGLIGMGLQAIISWQKQFIESFTERVSDRRECAMELAHLLGYRELAVVSESELRYGEGGYFGLPRPSGLFTALDLRPVLICKAIEHGLLIPMGANDVTPELVETYTLRIHPPLFAPHGAPSSASFQVSDPDPKEMIGPGVWGVIVFGAVAALVSLWAKSYWAILPACFAVVGLGMVFWGILSLHSGPGTKEQDKSEDIKHD